MAEYVKLKDTIKETHPRQYESCLNDNDEAALYWRAYLDGARARGENAEEQVAGTYSLKWLKRRGFFDETYSKCFLWQRQPCNGADVD